MQKQSSNGKCPVPGCKRNKRKDGRLCSAHNMRFWRTGKYELSTSYEKAVIRFKKALRENCIEYSKNLNREGYGRVWVNGKRVFAHRFSLELHTGEKIPKGMKVLHKCDNKKCINPEHLRPGTQAENVQDYYDKKNGKKDPF